jgi:hypothetical protein
MLLIPQVWKVVWNQENPCKAAGFAKYTQPYRLLFGAAIVVRSPRPEGSEASRWKQVSS